MGYRALIGLVIAVAFVCAGCEAQSTPVAAVNNGSTTDITPATNATSPATAPVTTPTTAVTLRYGLLASATGFRPMLEDNYDVLDVSPEDFPPVDIVLGVGYVEGWQQTPADMAHYATISDALPPLDNTAVHDIVQDALAIISQTIQPENAAIRDIRTRLANSGFPDGIEINLHAAPPAYADPLLAALETLNIRTQQTLTANSAHIRLYVSDNAPDDILIYRLPVSYRVLNPDVDVTFNASGIPQISAVAP